MSGNMREVLAMVLQALDRDAAEGRGLRGEMAAELRAAMEAQSAPAGEREAFEAWAASVGYHTERDMFQREKYQSTLTWELWRVWQASSAQQRTQAAGVPVIPQQWSKSLAHCWPEDSEDRDGDWCIGTIDEDGNFYEVVKVEASQYDAAGESQKIAEAIVALWAYAAPAQPEAQGECCHEFVPFHPACVKCGNPYDSPAAQDQPEVQRLREALRITRDTIDRQLEVIASRAPGNYLDKLPVVRSLKAHRARCDAALAASTGQEV